MENKYQTIKLIGEGAYGKVFLAKDILNNNLVVIKSINYLHEKYLVNIQNEIRTIRYFAEHCSPYAVKYIETFNTINNNGGMIINIVMEYIEGIDLAQYIKENRNLLDENPALVWSIMYSIIKALKCIHDNEFAHKDIKPENIIITNDAEIKIIDFGFSCSKTCKWPKCKNLCYNDPIGTPLYLPPEYYTGKYFTGLPASQKHDVWSLGITFYELANGLNKFPYPNANNQNELSTAIKSAPTKNSNYLLDPNINTFIMYILINNYRDRPTIDELYDKISTYIANL